MEEKRKTACRTDPGLFGTTYLSHYFSSESPPFHQELNDLWKKCVMKGSGKNPEKLLHKKGKRLAIAAPRGHAKSTVMSLQNLLHAALYGYKKYIILISDTESQAASFLDSIKWELEENPLLLEDFGPQKDKGNMWKSTGIVLANGCRIDVLGSGQKLRGRRNFERRPDLIVLDDIENDEEVRSPEGRRKLAAWYFSAVSKAGDYYTDLVFIGTVLHTDSLLAKLLQNPAYLSRVYKAVEAFSPSPLWKQWEEIYCRLSDEAREVKATQFFKTNRREMLKGTKVLWSAKLPYYDLMVMRLSEGEAAFHTEMQNCPIDRSTCLFPQEWTSYYNPLLVDFSSPEFDFYGYCDPSLGKNLSSDFSAIITLAKHRPSGVLYVESADLARRHPDSIIRDILDTAARLNRQYGKSYAAFGAETNQFQWFLKEQLAAQSAKEGSYLPICEVRNSTDKAMRIQTLQPYIKNRYILFNQSQSLLLNQLWDFPAGSHDDGPDALEGCVALSRKSQSGSSIQGLQL